MVQSDFDDTTSNNCLFKKAKKNRFFYLEWLYVSQSIENYLFV